MITLKSRGFAGVMYELGQQLMHDAKPVESQTWQSQSTEGRPGLGRTWELEDACFEIAVPAGTAMQRKLVRPNLPWADEHFYERVGGYPVNPPPSHERWPFRRNDNDEHLDGGQFSHTYPERFWPKHAGPGHSPSHCTESHKTHAGHNHYCDLGPRRGVRYEYGDLRDVVSLLMRDPTTRQAFLPVWFPEDTGTTDGQRVPCTLGYQFRIREGRLNCTYMMRSCDYLRHLRDDIYLAMRLMDWIAGSIDRDLNLGTLAMCIGSLHIFDGDRPNMKSLVALLARHESEKMMGAMR